MFFPLHLFAMAEVRLLVGRGAYKCAKPSYLSLLGEEGEPVLKAGGVAALIQSPQFSNVSACRVCPRTLKRKSSDSSKPSLDVLTEAISRHMWTDCIKMGTKADATRHRSLCMKTHVRRPLLCSNASSYQCFGLSQTRSEAFSSFSRAYSRKHDSTGSIHKSKSAYYDILDVSPTATHAQIKTAYYKQSFMYHPDRNSGSEEATFRFSQISEAYHVLGNKALRRKYDRGILSQGDLQESPGERESTAPSSNQKTRARHSPSVGANQEKIFDFDAFIRAHYGEQLQREKELRQRREKIHQKRKAQYEDVKLGRMKEVAVGMLLVMAMAIVLNMRSSN